MTRFRSTALLPLVLLAACDSPSAGGGPVLEILLPTSASIDFTSDGQGGPTYTCNISLHLRATGEPGDVVLLEGARLRWYTGIEPAAPVDSLLLTRAQVASLWGADEVRVNHTLEGWFAASAAAPFTLEAAFRYRSGSATREATRSVRCGPAIPAGTAAPTVTGVTVSRTDGEIDAGDSVAVTYQAASTAGLLYTEVIVDGPYRDTLRFQERFSLGTARTVQVPLGRRGRLGERASISVRAVDVGMQARSTAPVPTPVIVDRDPPQLRAALQIPPGPQMYLAGLFRAGETIQLSWEARDGRALAWLVYEMGAPANVRDSVPLQGNVSEGTLSIPVRPEWVGTGSFAVQLRDLTGLRTPWYVSAPGAFSILPALD